MSEIDEQASGTLPTLIEDVEIAQYILEMVPQVARLALRAGERELAEDLHAAVARAEVRRKRHMN